MNFSRQRKAIEKQYIGTCDILEYQPVRDEVKKRTTHQEVIVLEGQPCRLSFKTITTTGESNNVGTVSQSVKLFISPDIAIKPGSKTTVTQNGVTTDYSQSGVPAVYSTHQEVSLELFNGWS
ncbi:hypothetical protein [Peribacillus loiseleuriae]|uniref:Phage protein n=1 Tax=Peribacillus loiseleuriae TaxID=1679170 RepID=A0A0K9GRE7_9BACI|nr:hypothetical protein [Peribacillus loiseleuriae]KMY49230.1 hypothetical protein AC625_06590 [Peribacillus loiseleuriae]